MGKYLFATSTREGHSCLVQECYVVEIHVFPFLNNELTDLANYISFYDILHKVLQTSNTQHHFVQIEGLE